MTFALFLSSLWVLLHDFIDFFNPLPWSPFTDLTTAQIDGKVIVLTGGHSGCGYEVLRHICRGTDTRIYLLGRSIETMQAAVDRLQFLKGEDFNAEIVLIECDLADLTSIRKASEEFFAKETTKLKTLAPDVPQEVKLDRLFLNAGIITFDANKKTREGYELTWGTNVLGHHALLLHLLPALEVAGKHGLAPLPLDAEAVNFTPASPRVVWTGSLAHSWIWSLDEFYPLADKLSSRSTKAPYARSKAGNMLDLAYMLPVLTAKGIVGTVVHPGAFNTGIQREYADTLLRRVLRDYVYSPAWKASVNILWAAFAAEPQEAHGAYVTQWCKYGKTSALVRNSELKGAHGRFMDKIVEQNGKQKDAAGTSSSSSDANE